MTQQQKAIESARTRKSEIDVRLGQQIRKMRIMRGFSQGVMAKSIGVTFQQLQKYERGVNRVCVSRLVDICRFFVIQPSYIMNALINAEDYASNSSALNESDENFFYNPEGGDYDNKEILLLIRAYKSITNANIRRKVINLIRSLGEEDNGNDKS